MITELQLENFQGVEASQSVRLAPLTLIFGANSAGKSSLIRSLLLLKQSIDSTNQDNSKNLDYQGNSIDLASFANVINQHDLEKEMTIGFSSSIHNFGFLAGRSPGRRTMAQLIDRLDFVKFNTNSSENGLEHVTLTFHFKGESSPLHLFFSGEWIDSASRYFDWDLRSTDESLSPEAITLLNKLYSELRFHDEQREFMEPLEFQRFLNRHEEPDEEAWAQGLTELKFRGLLPVLPVRLSSISENEDFQAIRVNEIWESLFRVARNSINRTMENVSHIRPLREIPDRLGIVDSSKDHVSTNELNDSVSKWIERLTEGRYSLESAEFESSELSFMGTITSRYLVDNRTNTRVSFMDLGVGLSQVLPIIEELVRPPTRNLTTSSISKTVLIEQPELHLHPKMQAELMELFIETTLKGSKRLQIIAETHSEAMILRLQRQIRDGMVSRNQVAVLFVETGPDGTSLISELPIGEDGEFANPWPLSFSSVRVQEIF